MMTETPATRAASAGNCRIVRAIVAARLAAPSMLDAAIQADQLDVAQTLLKAGIRWSRDDPLSAAIARNNARMVHLLLRFGADANAVGLYGLRPLHTAIAHRCVPALALLLLYGADPNACSVWGFTPRDAARLVGDRASLRLLESWGATEGLVPSWDCCCTMA